MIKPVVTSFIDGRVQVVFDTFDFLHAVGVGGYRDPKGVEIREVTDWLTARGCSHEFVRMRHVGDLDVTLVFPNMATYILFKLTWMGQ